MVHKTAQHGHDHNIPESDEQKHKISIMIWNIDIHMLDLNQIQQQNLSHESAEMISTQYRLIFFSKGIKLGDDNSRLKRGESIGEKRHENKRTIRWRHLTLESKTTSRIPFLSFLIMIPVLRMKEVGCIDFTNMLFLEESWWTEAFLQCCGLPGRATNNVQMMGSTPGDAVRCYRTYKLNSVYPCITEFRNVHRFSTGSTQFP